MTWNNQKRTLLLGIAIAIAFIGVAMGLASDKQVDMKNYEAVLEKIEKDLSEGTKFNVVEQYLRETQWEHSFVERENAFYVMIKGVDRRLLFFKTDLWIRIYFDEDLRVRKFEHEFINTAP